MLHQTEELATFEQFTCLSCDDYSTFPMRKVSMEMILSMCDESSSSSLDKIEVEDKISQVTPSSTSSVYSFGRTLRNPSPITKAFDRIEGNRRKCRFFLSKKGCRKGRNCKFEHEPKQ
mmetsp:Transcript_9416/g.20006  ORF Transcript_9416/g.20006 Transcript_9416/m.20006 type:complete len:118 (-) Transcript_9416:126-479(-)